MNTITLKRTGDKVSGAREPIARIDSSRLTVATRCRLLGEFLSSRPDRLNYNLTSYYHALIPKALAYGRFVEPYAPLMLHQLMT